jgi:uncharacterized membrane protein YdjX (TVP38/TMEM64 family)
VPSSTASVDLRKLALVLVVLTGVGLFFGLDLGRFFGLKFIQDSLGTLVAARAAHPVQASLLFVAVYVGVTALSLPGAAILTLAGGALFGLVWGTLLVSVASTLGATLAMVTARYLLRDLVQARFGHRLTTLNQGIARDGAFYLFTLRLIPAMPFFVLNLLAGLTHMKIWTFAWVSQLGMLAATLVFVNAGTEIARIDSLASILSPSLIGSFVLLGLLPLLVRKALAVVQRRKVYARWKTLRPKRFDRNLVVIGAGAGGLVTAYIAAAVKAKVTLVEAHKMGGDCLNYGCVPSKALIRTARLAHQMRHGARYGLSDCAPAFSFPSVMQRIHAVIAAIEPHDSVERYTGLGVEVLQGYATIVNPWTVEIALNDGSKQTLTTRAIVIAAGAKPGRAAAAGVGRRGLCHQRHPCGTPLRSSTRCRAGWWCWAAAPSAASWRRASSAWARRSRKMEMAPRILLREDVDVSQLALESLQADGVQVLTGHKALRCERQGDQKFIVVGTRGRRTADRIRRIDLRRGPGGAPDGLRPGGTRHSREPDRGDQRIPADDLPQHLCGGRRGRALPVHPHGRAPGLDRGGECLVWRRQEVQDRRLGDSPGHLHRPGGRVCRPERAGGEGKGRCLRGHALRHRRPGPRDRRQRGPAASSRCSPCPARTGSWASPSSARTPATCWPNTCWP